jgi:hypothetical protein
VNGIGRLIKTIPGIDSAPWRMRETVWSVKPSVKESIPVLKTIPESIHESESTIPIPVPTLVESTELPYRILVRRMVNCSITYIAMLLFIGCRVVVLARLDRATNKVCRMKTRRIWNRLVTPKVSKETNHLQSDVTEIRLIISSYGETRRVSLSSATDIRLSGNLFVCFKFVSLPHQSNISLSKYTLFFHFALYLFHF